MRRLALAGIFLLGLPSLGAAGVAPDFRGSWVGNHAGREIVWELDGEGRLRIDGRGGDYQVAGDTLLVRFDPPPDAAIGERAVYRFVASLPSSDDSRLFVYGFDLGKQGLYLVKEIPAAEPELPEDAAPPVPGEPTSGPQAKALPPSPERP